MSIASLYNSPWVMDFNHQVTKVEIVGLTTFEAFKDPKIPAVASRPDQIGRLEDYIFGTDSSSVIRLKTDAESLPSHFGYDKYRTIAEVFNFSSKYVVIFPLDKVFPNFFPDNVKPNVNQYNENDFEMLNSDPAVNRIYDNGGFEVWKVT